MADEAATSRVLAGVQYPSDTTAGLEIGRSVGAMAVERARNDNFGLKWEGTIPNEPGKWTGPTAVNADEALWLPWVLSSPSQIRPGPPPAADSPQMAAELAEVKNFPRTPRTTGLAIGWQFVESGGPNFQIYWGRYASRLLLEEGQSGNLPRAAQVYFLMNIGIVDTWIATQDTKFTYWGIRPPQLDPSITTPFPTPPHPSYPSNGGSFNQAAALVLGHYFPRDAATLKGIADEIAESRLWAGIHFRSDLTSGQSMADQVVQMIKARAF
jgi:membrane-associated phospholipid phosphatase